MRKAKLGKKHTEEAKKNMSKSKLGRGLGPENSMYGKTHSEETKAKIGKKISIKSKGRILKEEHKANLSKARKVYHHLKKE